MLRRDGVDNAEPNAHPTLKQWSYETGRPASGLIRKALSHNHKIPRCNRPSAGSVAGEATFQPKGFDCAYTYYGRGSDGQEAIEGLCPSGVCFGASWPVECCACPRPLMAQRSRLPRCKKSRQLLMGNLKWPWSARDRLAPHRKQLEADVKPRNYSTRVKRIAPPEGR